MNGTSSRPKEALDSWCPADWAFNDSRRIMEAIEAEPREIGESSSPLKNTLHMVHRALSIDESPHDEVDPIKNK